MATTSASGALIPFVGLSGLSEGKSGEKRRSFFVLAGWRGVAGFGSLGFKVRDCRAGTAGLRLRWLWRLLERVPGLGLRELVVKRTRVLSSSELASELSERDRRGGARGVITGRCTCR